MDIAITTRELGRMIKQAGIDFVAMEDEKFDDPFDIGDSALGGHTQVFTCTGTQPKAVTPE